MGVVGEVFGNVAQSSSAAVDDQLLGVVQSEALAQCVAGIDLAVKPDAVHSTLEHQREADDQQKFHRNKIHF